MPDRNTVVLTETQAPIIEKHVTFGSNGIALHGKLFMPSIASKENLIPGAVMCHGYGSDKYIFENSARDLAQEGIAVLIFDFRGHGTSGGLLDGSVVDDVMDAWEYLYNQPEVDRDSMGLIGHSMGAFSAILAAGKLKQARVLVTLACPGEFNGKIAMNPRHPAHPFLKFYVKSIFKLVRFIFKFKVRVDWNKFIDFWPRMKPSQSLAELNHCSKLFVFCLDDLAAPYNRFVHSYSMAAEPKQIMVTTGNHNTPMESESLRKQWQKWTIFALHGKHPY